MAWQTLTVEKLKARFAPSEWSALQKAGSDLDDARAQAVCDQVTGTVRGYVAANRANRLGDEGTIPLVLVSAGLDLAVVEYSTTVGGVLLDPKGHRKNAQERATKLLEDVAAGKFAVDQPPAATADQAEQRKRPGPSIEEATSVLEST